LIHYEVTKLRPPELMQQCQMAHYCWRVGWDDADTELLESERHKKVLAEDGEDDFAATWGVLFDAGADALVNGIPFDRVRTQPWKEGWIDADINLGMITEEKV
jgi:hypothetical protein